MEQNKRYTVLVVEKNDEISRFYSKVIQKYNSSINFIRSRNGEEAIDQSKILLSNGGIDLVLTNIRLPIKDGFQVSEEISGYCKNNGLNIPPVIALSSIDSQDPRAKKYFKKFYTMPTPPEEIESILKSYLPQKN